jgi:hypothetical protein
MKNFRSNARTSLKMDIAFFVLWRNQKEMIKLYSTHCPKCKVLTLKLTQKNINFEVIDDIDAMLKMGIKSAPMLDVDGELLDFAKALAWVREQ